MRSVLPILLFFFFLFSGDSYAQNQAILQLKADYNFRYLDNSNGLLHNEVNAITQDSRGYIWLGTPKGLQRYDGLRLEHYIDSTVDPGESIIIAGLYADDPGKTVWVRTRDWEVKQFQWIKNKFLRTDVIDLQKGNNEKYIDKDGDAWVISPTAMGEPDRSGKTISGYVTIYKRGKKMDGQAYMLKDPANKKTWISLRNQGLLLLDGNTGKVYTKQFNLTRDPLLHLFAGNSPGVWRMLSDSNGNTWLYSVGELFYRYNSNSKKIFTYSLRGSEKHNDGDNEHDYSVTSLIEDNRGTIWIGTDNAGLLQFNAETDRFNVIKNKQKTGPGINYNHTINFLFQDREGNIWVASDKGISIFNPYRQYFSAIRHEENNPESLPNNPITAAIETSRGDIFIGTSGGGISVYDKQWRFRKTIRFKEADQNNIFSFVADAQGKILAGSGGGWLHIIDPATMAVSSKQHPELEKAAVTTMSMDDKGNKWFGLSHGKIIKWEKETNKFIRFMNDVKRGVALYAPINNIFIDHAGNFWITSLDGFKSFDENTGRFTAVYLPQKNNIHSISTKNCFGVDELNDSILVIGTGNGGLNYFNKKTRKFSKAVINEDGEIHSVFAVKKDETGNTWFTTDYDIYKLDASTNQFSACNLEKGLINSFFRPGRFYAGHRGQWLTWTYAEVLGFYPDSIARQQNNIMPVTITGFEVLGQSINIDTLIHTGAPIHLSYRQNFINIEFASINFLPAKQINYYYQLLGIDEDWVSSGTKQFASYTKLAPGTYTFRVSTIPGSNSAKMTSFDIIIVPPFWGTWWFRISVLLIIASGIFLLIRRRITAIRHQSEMKQKIAETEMTALRAQMNPHFIFNCLSAIDNLIQTNQPDKATKYLARFAKLIRSILYSSKNNLVPFHKDLETLQLYLEMEQFRSNDKFSYTFDIDPTLLNTDYEVPPMIVQPFLENAIHHGLLNKQSTDRELKICIRLKEDHILYTISDNGIGRQTAAALKELNRPEHISYGIQIITNRVQLHNRSDAKEDLTITDLQSDGRPAGTTVEVKIIINDTNK